MKLMRLIDGYADVADMRDYPPFAANKDAADKLEDGAEVPRFVFHSLSGSSPQLRLRGRAASVTDGQAEYLLGLRPALVFVEVPQEQHAAEEALRATPHFTALEADAIRRAAVAPKPAPDTVSATAQSEPRDAKAIQREVEAELRALSDPASRVREQAAAAPNSAYLVAPTVALENVPPAKSGKE